MRAIMPELRPWVTLYETREASWLQTHPNWRVYGWDMEAIPAEEPLGSGLDDNARRTVSTGK